MFTKNYMSEEQFHYQTAIQDFRRARRRASLEHLLSFLNGTSDELLSYEEVRKKLKMTGMSSQKLEEIPLDAIVGSVGRYKDFTRSFLPKIDHDEQRWANVQAVAQSMVGLPPIEVYQIGDAYFVLDGNHRVSVARQLGAQYIEAYVTKIQTKVPLSRDMQPDELAIKAEYADFLSHTHLDEFRPDADFTMSLPGKYQILEEQIEEHRHYMGITQHREIPYNEAVLNWYDHVYLPIAEFIRKKGILKDFPEQTLAVLYLWISEYRATIRQGAPGYLEENINKIFAKLPVLPDVEPDTLILNAEYVDFLENTQIEDIRPDAELRVTAPGKYRDFYKHIDVHRHFMGEAQQREIPYYEAVAHWYDMAYIPVVRCIRARGMLRDFPNRTEADLYLWISEHRARLEQRLGWKLRLEAAVTDLAEHFSPTPERVLARVGEKVLDALTPDEFETGPATGAWRRAEIAVRRKDRLFASILVPVSGQKSGWRALEQAIRLARSEEGHLYGLHVIARQDKESQEFALTVRNEFIRRCQEAGVQGELAIEQGEAARKICERARWMDLIVLNLAHPPGSQPFAKLKSGFRTVLRRCSRPVLAVPHVPQDIQRALLAYDGSEKADEALFIGAYLGGYLHIPLIVVTVEEIGRTSSEVLSLAREYLYRRNVNATFIEEVGAVSDSILHIAARYDCDLIIMGGYGRGPVLEVVLGSALDQILQKSQVPTLICR